MCPCLRGLILCVLSTAAFSEETAPAVPEKPVPIAVVRTLAELLSQPGMKLKGDKDREVSVRLGIEAHQANAGTGLLLYAVADSAAIALNSPDDLGPVVIKVHREGAEEEAERLEKLQRQWPEAPLYFFAKSIPLPTSGRYGVKAFSPDKKHLLAETTIEVAAGPADEPCWHEFQPSRAAPQASSEVPWAGTFSVGAKALPKFGGEEAVPLFAAGADGKVEGADKIALPRLIPPIPVNEEPAAPNADLAPQIAGLILKLGNEAYELREKATLELAQLGRRAESALQKAFLEGDDPEIRNRAWYLLRALDGPFTVRLVDGVFLMNTAIAFDPAVLDEHLLARWWINGKPLAERKVEELMRNGNGQIIPTRLAALAIDLSALELKAADTVDVEFLYCPKGTERIVEDVMLAHMAVEEDQPDSGDLLLSTRCLRSNRLRFAPSELKRKEE